MSTVNTVIKKSRGVSTDKAKQVEMVIRGLNHLRFDNSSAMIADIAEVSEKYVHIHKNENMLYSLENTIASDEDIDFIFRRSIELGIIEADSFETVLGVILGTYLKIKTDVLINIRNLKGIWSAGKNIAILYYRLHKRDDGIIHSRLNSSARYLLNSNIIINLDKLFIRSDSYKTTEYSKEWKATDLLIEYINITINTVIDYISTSNNILELLIKYINIRNVNTVYNINYNINNSNCSSSYSSTIVVIYIIIQKSLLLACPLTVCLRRIR
jgi:hypothetical protein